MRIAEAFLTLTLCSFSAFAGGPTLPQGWRLPTETEANGNARKDSSIHSLVNGDWDRDGLVDGAILAISNDGLQEGLLVVMFPAGKETWLVLDAGPFDKVLFMGLAKLPPGTYQVTCQNESECQSTSKKSITFVQDTFSYFRPESASSIFAWNPQQQTFERIWETD